jgi:hypothetical protein
VEKDMKTNSPSRVLTTIVLAALVAGCMSYRYAGDGDYDEYSRTYVPVIGVTKGFMIALPSFRASADVNTSFHMGRLPRYNDSIYIDLVSATFDQPPTLEEDKQAAESIPREHRLACSLIDKKTGQTIGQIASSVRDFPKMKNRMLRRECVFNLMEIEMSKVPPKSDLEVKIQYSINGKPLDREMTIAVSMEPPTA